MSIKKFIKSIFGKCDHKKSRFLVNDKNLSETHVSLWRCEDCGKVIVRPFCYSGSKGDWYNYLAGGNKE